MWALLGLLWISFIDHKILIYKVQSMIILEDFFGTLKQLLNLTPVQRML